MVVKSHLGSTAAQAWEARQDGGAVSGSVVPELAVEPTVPAPTFVCRHCGAAMTIIETLVGGQAIRAPPS